MAVLRRALVIETFMSALLAKRVRRMRRTPAQDVLAGPLAKQDCGATRWQPTRKTCMVRAR